MGNIKFVGVLLIISVILIGALTFWHGSRTNNPPELVKDAKEDFNGPLTLKEQKINNQALSNNMNPIAVFNTNKGVVEIELFADQMPITVDNFVTLAESGFYNNTKFHRVIEGFMIQGGDPNTKGNDESIYGIGGPDQNVQDEFVKGELLTNIRGTIAMANTGQPNSGGSQFFINLVDNTGLDFDKEPLTSKHPVFGRVIKGMDVVDAISHVDTNERDIPVDPVVIESIVIEKK